MKHPKKLTVEMKKLLSKNGLNPKDYGVVMNTSEEITFLNKLNRNVVVYNKKRKILAVAHEKAVRKHV